MRTFLLILILIIFVSKSACQTNLILYTGLTYSSITTIGVPTTVHPYLLKPCIGFDVDKRLTKKMSVSLGAGINVLGTSRYFESPDSAYLYINKSYTITYLRFPFKFQYQFKNGFTPFVGYSLNYSIRVNQYNIDVTPDGKILSKDSYEAYNKYHHAFLLGLRKDFGNLSIALNYQIGLNYIFNAKYQYFDISLTAFQLTLGYLISE